MKSIFDLCSVQALFPWLWKLNFHVKRMSIFFWSISFNHWIKWTVLHIICHFDRCLLGNQQEMTRVPEKRNKHVISGQGFIIKVVKWYTFYIWPVLKRKCVHFRKFYHLKMFKYRLTKALNSSSMNTCTISF